MPTLELSDEMVRIFAPVINEMRETECELTEDEFVEAACRLYEALSLPEKNAILGHRNKKRKSSVSQEPSFTVSGVVSVAED